MKFPTASKTPRPIRLSPSIRAWAWESLHGKYGTEALQTPYIDVSDREFHGWDDVDGYDYAIRTIAEKAPLRITEEELISGSATLGSAIWFWHNVPAWKNGASVFGGVSHLTIDYETTLRYGVDYYEQKIAKRLLDSSLSDRQRRFLQSLQNVIDSLRIYHARYLEKTKLEKPQIYQNLLQVPFSPARTFHEAVQSIWFIFSFVRLCGNWPGIGRIDRLLGDYLKRDLQEGRVTIEKAREILASFFIKGTEWIQKDTPPTSGDAQHYQNIVLSGIDKDGKDVTNEVTYLVLDIVEELGISDFPITVRINEKTSEKLLDKVARVMRHGGGVVAVYNEPLILRAMQAYGYPEREARDFANDGCWEVQVPGKTFFVYSSFDSLHILQQQTLCGYACAPFDSFDSLYNAYVNDLKKFVGVLFKELLPYAINEPGAKQTYPPAPPCPVVSLFMDGCIDNARSYWEGGPVYNVSSPHIGGIADTVNSLYAIKKLVFDDRKVSFEQLMQVLKNNWQDNEPFRQIAASYRYYGTDNDEVDGIYTSLLHDFTAACRAYDKGEGYLFAAGASTFGREIDWSKSRLATPQGTKVGEVLASNSSPSPGTDLFGATAAMRSYCKADLTETVTGAALDLKISPETLTGKNGVEALKSLIRGFIQLGGYFFQIDTVDADTLRQAQKDPKRFKTLSVRVSGWNARFITLTKEWQDMIIQRTNHNAL